MDFHFHILHFNGWLVLAIVSFNRFVFYNEAQRSSISVVRVFEDDIFILPKISLRDELFNLAINPALPLIQC